LELTVLITGVGPGSTGEQVWKALSLGSRPYRLVAGNVDPSRAVIAPLRARVALPPASDPGYLRALARAANQVGARFVVPGSDPELARVVEGREELAGLTGAIPLANGAATVALCGDKGATAAAIARAGLRSPRSAECADPARAVEAAAAAGIPFPVVVKPRRGGGGSVDVFLAQDADELRFFARWVHRNGTGRELLLQEYVGTPEDEYTVGVLSWPDGAIAGSFALRRELTSVLSTRLLVPNRTGRADLGPRLAISTGFTQGSVDAFPEVRAAAERVAAAVGSGGPLNVQGRLVDGELVVFEINPRFSGTEAMRAMAGWNQPEALLEWHLGVSPRLPAWRARRITFVRTLSEHELVPWAAPAGVRGAPVA
jgi:carbamoyl-phosphate synthase large subunit